MTATPTTQRPDAPCKCGGSAAFIGMQVMKQLNFQFPMYQCRTCDTSIGGTREPLECPTSAIVEGEVQS